MKDEDIAMNSRPMSNIDKQALRVPEREKYDWSQAVMRDCDFCQQWDLTVKHSDGGCICASCCDSEYTSALSCALVAAIARAEAAEKRIADYQELISGLVGVSSSILREVERINKDAGTAKG